MQVHGSQCRYTHGIVLWESENSKWGLLHKLLAKILEHKFLLISKTLEPWVELRLGHIYKSSMLYQFFRQLFACWVGLLIIFRSDAHILAKPSTDINGEVSFLLPHTLVASSNRWFTSTWGWVYHVIQEWSAACLCDNEIYGPKILYFLAESVLPWIYWAHKFIFDHGILHHWSISEITLK